MLPVSMYRAVFEIKNNVGLDLIKYNKGTWIPPLGGGFKSLRSPVYLDPQDYNADLRDEQVMFIIGLTQFVILAIAKIQGFPNVFLFSENGSLSAN